MIIGVVQNAIISQIRRKTPSNTNVLTQAQPSGVNTNQGATKELQTTATNPQNTNTTANTNINQQGKVAGDSVILAKLQELNLSTTGSKQGDLAAIKAATSYNNTINTPKSNFHTANNKPPINPTIKNKLDELNLKPTGSNKGDLAAIQNAMAHSTIFNSIQDPNFILWLDKIK